MSTPTWLFGSSTITRPAPSVPRRKSMSFSASWSRFRLSAKRTGSAVEGVGCALAAAEVSSTSTSALPCSCAL